MTTDYAIRIVLHLAAKKDYANSNEISKEMGIPRTYILKQTKVLKEAGIIDEKRGVNGGFILKADPNKLTLLDVSLKFEKTMIINRCLEEDQHCSRHAASYCKVRKLLGKAQSELSTLLSVKISEFL
ncbi:MAG: Rrf2 family transcriptional regulator [Oscillospiraceae bacterium]|nr:Rrf2 family transcriptional regulator [Oscillospiraceae bacterium]